MKREWLYCFPKGAPSDNFLALLMDEREKGCFLGSTYPSGYCHSCFSEEHCCVLNAMVAEGRIDCQVIEFKRGNVLDEDYNINTFIQPFIQWCPSPVYSQKFSQFIPPSQLWGLTMEGGIVFQNQYRNVLANDIVGMNCVQRNDDLGYDTYEISQKVTGVARVDDEISPMSLGIDGLTVADVFYLPDINVIVCSNRFAKILKAGWDGLVYNKFQPICIQHKKTDWGSDLKQTR